MPTEDFYYGDVAESYDEERAHSPIWRKEDEIVEALLTHLRSSEDLVLDVPVGTGRFLPLYDKLEYESIGVDVSDDMLRQAHAHLGAKAQIARGDIRQLPLRDASLGLVVCIRLMHLVKPATGRAAVADLARVVKPGGYLILGARLHGGDNEHGWASRFRDHMTRTRRIADHWLGRTNSRSHGERWLMSNLRQNGFKMRSRHLVTRYKDGSRYLILLLERSGAEASRVKATSVELFGLPGVGKSTLFNALAKDPTLSFSDGFAIMEELSLWECIRRRPLATTRLLARLGPSWRDLKRQSTRKAVVTALRQLVAQRSRQGELCLFQEGTCHEVWRQIFRDGDLSDHLLSKLLPVADLTILIEAPMETIAMRLATKRHPGPINRELMAEPVTGPLWDLATISYGRVRAGVESRGGRTVVIQNGEDQESGVDRIRAILSNAHQGRIG